MGRNFQVPKIIRMEKVSLKTTKQGLIGHVICGDKNRGGFEISGYMKSPMLVDFHILKFSGRKEYTPFPDMGELMKYETGQGLCSTNLRGYLTIFGTKKAGCTSKI